jgi:hypothetical protein
MFGVIDRNALYIVLWPAFGYFDPLTWLRIARKASLYLVFHDIRPLRRQFGYSRFARACFRWSARAGRWKVICHTESAAVELQKLTGVRPRVLPLPVAAASVGTARDSERAIRVMGQYKSARTLEPLHMIASSQLREEFSLELHGRGWPDVVGWQRDSSFLPEETFAELIRTAACVVIPYRTFYQSGIAVQCLENRTPVVAPEHPQIEELFGRTWAGLVQDDDWVTAIERALRVESRELALLHSAALKRAIEAWNSELGRVLMVGPVRPPEAE